MSVLTYTGTNGLFVRGGKLVKAIGAHATVAGTTLPAEEAYIDAVFDAAGRDDQASTLASDYVGFQNQQTAIRQRLASYFSTVIQDRVEVLVPLGLLQGGLTQQFWQAFLRIMGASYDAQTVQKCVVSIGSVTAGATNVGTGTVLLTGRLDGVTAPYRGGMPNQYYAGLTSELGRNETHIFQCVTDKGLGATAGQETLSWTGGQNYGAFDWRGEGSGQGPSLTLAAPGGLVTDGSFERWTATNTPSAWPIVSGTAGTHILQNNATVLRDLASLQFTGDGALASICVKQAPQANQIVPLRMYCLSLWLKADATIGAGTFTAGFVGTGYTAGGGETISIAHGSLPTSYTLYSAFILAPASIPSDLTVQLNWSGTPTSGKSIYIDSCSLQAVTYHGGVGAVAVPGATDLFRGDQWTSAVTNDNAGLFQSFARQAWGVQLPSTTGGSATIANSLAT